MVYSSRYGRTLLRSTGACPEDERHSHVTKDFIFSLQCGVRNKIAKKWSELKNPHHIVQDALDLAVRMEVQMQVTDSFKLEFSGSYISPDVNETNMANFSTQDLEVSKVSSGKNGTITTRKVVTTTVMDTTKTIATTLKIKRKIQVTSGNVRVRMPK